MFTHKKHIKRFYFFIFPLLILLLIFLFLKKDGLPETKFFKIISKTNIFFASPLINLRNKFINLKNSSIAYFISKKELSDLNNVLKEENLKLKSDVFKLDVLEKQNNDLLNILGRKKEKNFIPASLIFKPSFSKFDFFLIDAGSRDGIKKGMKVEVFNNFLIGEVYDVFEKESKVMLYSALNNKIGVYLEKSGIRMIATGKGSENFEIILAKNTDIAIGDKILTQEITPFILGEIMKIIENENDIFKKAYFRYPFNLNEIKYVYVLF